MKKKTYFLTVIMLVMGLFPLQILAAGKKQAPKPPYEKVIYKNGSWLTLWNSNQLITGYDGTYEIDQELFINPRTGQNISDIPPVAFWINREQIVSEICLPYIYYPLSDVQPGHIEPVYLQLEDTYGNLYGPYLMEGKKTMELIAQETKNTAQDWGQIEEDFVVKAMPVPYSYTLSCEGGLRLPRGNYTLHTSDSANRVRTKNSGLLGPVLIKGYEASAYDKYQEKLLLWNMKNNPELFENHTVIRELVDGEEVDSGQVSEEEYTVLGNMDLLEYKEEADQEKKAYPVESLEGNPLANFPLYISLPAPGLIDEIAFNTYNGGLGAPPGTISITGVASGEDFGSFQANGATLQGIPNGMWLVSPSIILPAGEYKIDVSDPVVVSSFSGGRPDFYIGAKPPPPVDHNFSGTYLINVTTQKTGAMGLVSETGKSEDSFSLSSHPVTVVDKGDHILIIGGYEGISISRQCSVSGRTPNSLKTSLEFSIDLSGTPAKTIISAGLDITLLKPESGLATTAIAGNASYDRESTQEQDGDFNTYQVKGNGLFSGQEIPTEILPFMGLGLASAGNIPGPDNLGQGAVGVLFPPMATVLMGLLESLLRRQEETLLPGELYDFGDGREYREGSSYTFDDGGEYILKNGEFELISQLSEGDHYINPDGESKVWIGGQSWYESDWEIQDAINRDYAHAHAQDWANVSASPDQYMQEAFDQIRTDQDLYEQLGRMERAAWRADMASPGQIDDMYLRINDLINDLDAGKPGDPEKVQRIQDYIEGRLGGTISHERDLASPEKYGGWFDADLLGIALTETGRNLSSATTADGSTSWVGLAGRIAIGTMTAGQSEWVFRPIGATYTMHDAIQAGASGLEAFGAGVVRVGTEWVATNAMAGIASTVTGAGKSAISHIMSTGGSGQGLGSAILSGGAKGASRWGAGMAAQVSDVASSQAWAAQANRFADSLQRGVSRIDSLLSGKEGLRLPGSGPGVQVPVTSPKQALNPLEQKQLKDFERAIRSGDPKQIAREYANGGMNKLSQLQQKGHISAAQARQANQLLSRTTNRAIQQGTHDALKKTQQQTGVRVKELIIGDSGSGARRSVGRIMTDTDRTLIPRFEEADLRKYMKVNKMTRPQAYNSLCKEFQKNHISSVSKSLGKSGLSAEDVGFASYDRIGSASGQADSYGSRFTNIRQAGSGTAQVYIPDGKGGFRVYSTSGQAVVDQNLLTKKIYATGKIPSNPLKLLPKDVPSIIKQQTSSIMKNPRDPLAAAKAIGRANKVSYTIKNRGILSKSLGDMNSRLVRMADQMYSDPSSINTVLRRNGMTMDQFLRQSKDLMSGYNRTLSNIRF